MVDSKTGLWLGGWVENGIPIEGGPLLRDRWRNGEFRVTRAREQMNYLADGWTYAVRLTGPALTRTGNEDALRRGAHVYRDKPDLASDGLVGEIHESIQPLLLGREALLSEFLRAAKGES